MKYRHNIRSSGLGSIYIYDFKSVARAIKQSYINYIDFMTRSKIKCKHYTWLLELKNVSYVGIMQSNIFLLC